MGILNNALSGSLAAQAAVNAASQNIANLQTRGYTRQGVLLGSLSGNGGRLAPGSGVEVQSLLRFSDAYKNQQMWRAASDQGARSQTQPYLTQLERIMGDNASSISNGVDNFFRALNAAGADPTSTPLRQQVVTAADAMAQHFNSINNVMNNQLLSVHQQRSAILPQANTALAGIAELNGKISAAGASGANPSALIDARDLAIDGLATQMALEVVDQPDGSRNVSLRSGEPLVIGNIAGTLGSALDASGTQIISLQFTNANFKVDNVGIGGQMGGLGAFERDVLAPLQQSVRDIASAVSDKINAQLALGQTMAGAAGTPLFVFGVSGGAGILKVSAGFGAGDLAFSSDGTPGNNNNLQLLIDIKNQAIPVTSIGNVLLSDADTQLVGKLAIDSQKNKALLSTADTVRNQAVADWNATSGVNKDEEAVNLLEFQNMFQANMKVISVANEMFDATLAMMR
ncbi:flagellar hook-associated protein FlgK [Janthinobacterium sp. CG_S6]|uniref:flagellar hook-associated protein FlgK n=1 Tax=Janthinobacterium sp. CG_S6 TaxID=3071707 RepID=UPI002DFAAD6E|nr:flagellar hook-associated protein 1 FlgK [Janthinobacterium sp. CG_S6]